MLRARQTRWFSKFSYDFLDASSGKIGSITWPDLAVGTNSRIKDFVPKGLDTQVQIELRGRGFLLDFEFLNRAWNNDIRFTLKEGDAVLASADVTQKNRARPSIRITNPFEGDLIRRGGLFAARYEVVREEKGVGLIFEKPALRLTRELLIDLPETVEEPVQCFLFFLVMNHAFR